MWKNIVQPDSPQMKIRIVRSMLFASWIRKGIKTHSEFVIPIFIHGNNFYENSLQKLRIYIPGISCFAVVVGARTYRR